MQTGGKRLLSLLLNLLSFIFRANSPYDIT